MEVGKRERERERWAISPSSPRLGTLSTAPRIAVLVPLHTDESFSFLGKEAECSSWSFMKVSFRPLGTLCCVYLLEYAKKKKNQAGFCELLLVCCLWAPHTLINQHSASSSLNIYSHWVVLDDWCLLLSASVQKILKPHPISPWGSKVWKKLWLSLSLFFFKLKRVIAWL